MNNETKEQRSARARESKYMGSCSLRLACGDGGPSVPSDASSSCGWDQGQPPASVGWNAPYRNTGEGTVPEGCGVEKITLPDVKIHVRDFVLRSADKAINGPRQDSYGPPGENFSNIARLWSVYLGYTIMPEDVAMLMVLLKVARAKGGSAGVDTYVDIAGYAALGAEVEAEGGVEQTW